MHWIKNFVSIGIRNVNDSADCLKLKRNCTAADTENAIWIQQLDDMKRKNMDERAINGMFCT